MTVSVFQLEKQVKPTGTFNQSIYNTLAPIDQARLTALNQSRQTGNTVNYGTNALTGATNTTWTNTYAPAPGGAAPVQQQQQVQQGPSDVQIAEDRTRSDINQGYNDYFGQLDAMLGEGGPIKSQEAALTGMATAQGAEMQNTLEGQKTEGLVDLSTQQRQTDIGVAKNLQGLAEDVRNLMKTGQIRLGAMGAGDSSAANQYSYAIAKMGNQNRGAIMQQANELHAQIQDKEFKLKNVYNTESNNIKAQLQQKTYDITNWFASAQQKILDAKAAGTLARDQDIAALSRSALDYARNQVLTLQAAATNRQSLLDQWAVNNSKTITELKTNLTAAKGTPVAAPTAQPLALNWATDVKGNTQASQAPGMGYRAYGTTKYDENGQPIV